MAARAAGRRASRPSWWTGPTSPAHPRAEFAADVRDHPRIVGYQDPGRSALAVISAGIAGLTELSFELEPGHRGTGGGARLARDVLSAVPSGQLAVAAVAPGNAASVRALLAARFKPLGFLQLFRRAGRNPGTGDLAPAPGHQRLRSPQRRHVPQAVSPDLRASISQLPTTTLPRGHPAAQPGSQSATHDRNRT